MFHDSAISACLLVALALSHSLPISIMAGLVSGGGIGLIHIDTVTRPIRKNAAYSALKPSLRDSAAVR